MVEAIELENIQAGNNFCKTKGQDTPRISFDHWSVSCVFREIIELIQLISDQLLYVPVDQSRSRVQSICIKYCICNCKGFLNPINQHHTGYILLLHKVAGKILPSSPRKNNAFCKFETGKCKCCYYWQIMWVWMITENCQQFINANFYSASQLHNHHEFLIFFIAAFEGDLPKVLLDLGHNDQWSP